MRKIIITVLLLALTNGLVYCQKFYFKILPGYNISVCTQQMPDYLSHNVTIITGSGLRTYSVDLDNDRFSVASGLNLMAAAGYRLNDYISFELKLSAFTNTKKEFKPSASTPLDGKTEWDMKSLSLLPTIMFGRSFNKTAVNIFAWAGPGMADLNITTSYNEDFREFEYDRRAIFSWGYGLEFSYAISGHFSLFTNISVDNSYYSPGKANMVSSYYSPEYLYTYQKEIIYVDEITDLSVWWNNTPVYTEPDTRLRETLRSNSLWTGIGIKYTIGK